MVFGSTLRHVYLYFIELYFILLAYYLQSAIFLIGVLPHPTISTPFCIRCRVDARVAGTATPQTGASLNEESYHFIPVTLCQAHLAFSLLLWLKWNLTGSYEPSE